jgi:hypothetical protein
MGGPMGVVGNLCDRICHSCAALLGWGPVVAWLWCLRQLDVFSHQNCSCEWEPLQLEGFLRLQATDRGRPACGARAFVAATRSLASRRPLFLVRMAERKTIVASGYKQVGSRATPEAITKELRKLPAAAGPLDARKRALHDLAHALAYVQEQHKVIVCDNCKNENAAGLLIQLLTDIDTAPPVPSGEDVIRVGRRVLGMGPMDARLYVLSCFVNLAYLGGAGQLRLPPDGLPYSGASCLSERLLARCAAPIARLPPRRPESVHPRVAVTLVRKIILL